MSNSLVNTLAAMLQGTPEPKAQNDDRPVAKGSAFELIRLLNAKQYDRNAVVMDSNGLPLEFEDGEQITFGDLAYREENAVRQDGTVGPNYPVVWGLTQSECSAAINWLKSQLDKPKTSTAKRSNGGQKKAASQNDSSDMLAQALLAALRQAANGDQNGLQAILGVAEMGQPATPVPAAGHRKVARPATPVAEEPNVVDLTPGQIVRINGELRQIAADGKRLNKTIV